MSDIRFDSGIDVWSQKIKKPAVYMNVTNLDTNKRTATMTCPKCANIQSLRDHHINDYGFVSPSVECSYNHCDFHDKIQLIGWDEINWDETERQKTGRNTKKK